MISIESAPISLTASMPPWRDLLPSAIWLPLNSAGLMYPTNKHWPVRIVLRTGQFNSAAEISHEYG